MNKDYLKKLRKRGSGIGHCISEERDLTVTLAGC